MVLEGLLAEAPMGASATVSRVVVKGSLLRIEHRCEERWREKRWSEELWKVACSREACWRT
jgi:hypothetical protein